ncbi:hypothetical protein C8Q80DRAFT_1137070 [Daedaleopsis nitida]|nr:hypothetical protein C8Q80DRAFT_1137070 [Daedaleopsis nitida]
MSLAQTEFDPDFPSIGFALRALERGELPGNLPLQEWEDASKLNVEVNIYGGNGQHGLVRMHLPKPTGSFQEARIAVIYMSFDLKHSKVWTCEFCDKPARETQLSCVDYMTIRGFVNDESALLPVWRMPVYIHHVCAMEHRKCQPALRQAHNRINEKHAGLMGPHVPPEPRPGGRKEVYPLSASCAHCKTDASSRADMKRCSACKMTRYCSADCQRGDWRRHKTACKCVRSVEITGFAN